jgi:DNA-binding MarR family transcriptional regulator
VTGEPWTMTDAAGGVGLGRRVAFITDAAEYAPALAQDIAEAGLAVDPPQGIVEACASLARLVNSAVTFLYLRAAPKQGGAGESLLDRLDAASSASGLPIVAEVVPGLVDLAAARFTAPNVTLLCEASRAERVAALVMAANSTGLSSPQVWDKGREASGARLRQLSEEVDRIARTLAAISGQGGPALPRPDPVGPAAGGDDPPPAEAAATIRRLIRARRLREQFFSAELFSDPAWDMMLDLAAARLERRRVAVSSLCIAAAVPATTALRWIKNLTEAGLFVRRDDPQDGRRVFIDLAEPTAEAMAGYLRQLRAFKDLPT